MAAIITGPPMAVSATAAPTAHVGARRRADVPSAPAQTGAASATTTSGTIHHSVAVTAR